MEVAFRFPHTDVTGVGKRLPSLETMRVGAWLPPFADAGEHSPLVPSRDVQNAFL